mmetsp:Transcript_30791/g.72254  ORF Transcript_30791/g.72254 Transcript_30791/m.72254 type:complete len:143 (+) Transcript_30791:54-482(+)
MNSPRAPITLARCVAAARARPTTTTMTCRRYPLASSQQQVALLSMSISSSRSALPAVSVRSLLSMTLSRQQQQQQNRTDSGWESTAPDTLALGGPHTRQLWIWYRRERGAVRCAKSGDGDGPRDSRWRCLAVVRLPARNTGS